MSGRWWWRSESGLRGLGIRRMCGRFARNGRRVGMSRVCGSRGRSHSGCIAVTPRESGTFVRLALDERPGGDDSRSTRRTLMLAMMMGLRALFTLELVVFVVLLLPQSLLGGAWDNTRQRTEGSTFAAARVTPRELSCGALMLEPLFHLAHAEVGWRVDGEHLAGSLVVVSCRRTRKTFALAYHAFLESPNFPDAIP